MSGTDTDRARPALRVASSWLPAIAYMALIWWLSSAPIVLPLPSIPWRDKVLHGIEYAILGLLVARAVRGTWPALTRARALSIAVLITIAWGYFDEVHQAFVPGRDASASDLLADAAGAVLGVLLYGAASLLLRKRRKRREALAQ